MYICPTFSIPMLQYKADLRTQGLVSDMDRMYPNSTRQSLWKATVGSNNHGQSCWYFLRKTTQVDYQILEAQVVG